MEINSHQITIFEVFTSIPGACNCYNSSSGMSLDTAIKHRKKQGTTQTNKQTNKETQFASQQLSSLSPSKFRHNQWTV
jgi:hypothetical protein